VNTQRQARFESPMRRGSRQKRSNPVLGIIVFLIFLGGTVLPELFEGGFSPIGLAAFFGVLGPAVVMAVVFIVVAKLANRQQESLTGGAEAGHLCEAHNGVPTKRGRKAAAAPQKYETGDLRRKTDEINDLYAAGIIDGAERAERLAALR